MLLEPGAAILVSLISTLITIATITIAILVTTAIITGHPLTVGTDWSTVARARRSWRPLR